MPFPVSSNWYKTLTQSHRVAVQFAVYTAGLNSLLYESPIYVGSASGQTAVANLPVIQGGASAGKTPNPFITGGSVTLEKSVDQRGRFTMTLVDATDYLIEGDVLSPWGNEIRLYRGLAYDDGTTEMPLLGTFRITDVEAKDDGGAVQITIQGQDRSRIISRNKVVQFYQTASNQAYSDAIRAMCQFAYPAVQFSGTSNDWLTIPPAGIGQYEGSGYSSNMVYTPTVYGITFQEGDDLWTEARNMARSLACDLYFDRYGVLTLQYDPNLNYMNGQLPTIPAPVFSFIEGETATFVNTDLKKSDQDVYNAWVITGEGQVIGYTQAPMRSNLVVDNDPNSPTYINGPYGTVVGFETNDLMVTLPQINAYANFRLATSVGKQQTVQIQGFVDSSLEVDDPISITRARVGITNQLFIIDTLQIPLTTKDAMSLTTRERRALTYVSS